MAFTDDIWAQAQELSPLIAGLTAAGNHQKAEQLRQEMLKRAEGLNPQDFERMKATLQGDSEASKYSEDPALRGAEMDALARYKDIAANGGMDAQARAKLAEARSEANQYERGQREALTGDFAERGLGGSGAELAAKLQAQQGGADREASGGIQAASDAEVRALQAIKGGAALGGQVRGEDADIAKWKSGSQDAINRFNASMRNNADQANVNQANDVYGRQVQKNQLLNGIADKSANAQDAEAQRKRNYFGSTLSAVTKGIGGI